MKLLCLITAACLAACSALPARQRDWKVGTLLETAHAREPGAAAAPSATATVANVPAGGGNPYPAAAAAAGAAAGASAASALSLGRPSTLWQGFRIEGGGYRFMVMCPVWRNHSPNVTVNGPVKYTMEKGKFYLLDEDGKEWQMTVLEKALLPAPSLDPQK